MTSDSSLEILEEFRGGEGSGSEHGLWYQTKVGLLILILCKMGIIIGPTSSMAWTLVSCYTCNKLSKNEWLKTTQIYYHILPVVWSSKCISLGYSQYVSRATFLSESSRGRSIILPFLEASRDFHRFLATTPGCLPTAIFCTSNDQSCLSHMESHRHWAFCLPLPLRRTHVITLDPSG